MVIDIRRVLSPGTPVAHNLGREIYPKMQHLVNKTTNLTTVYATGNSFGFAIRFVSSFVVIFIIVLALIGNSLVIRAFFVFRKLRNVTNHFVVSLAVTDILVAVFSMPVWVAFLVTGPDWTFSRWLMQIWKSVDIISGVASISHLLLISIERYICISSPLTYHSIVTTVKARIAMCAVWLFSLLMAVIKLFLLGRSSRPYQVVTFMLCFVVPVIIMGSVYVLIFRVSRTQAKKIILRIGQKTKRFSLPKEMKAAKTLGVVMGAFVFCWFPFFFLNILHALCQ